MPELHFAGQKVVVAADSRLSAKPSTLFVLCVQDVDATEVNR